MRRPRRDRAAAVELRGIRKTYGAGTDVEVEVLHGIDLALARGEFTALIGPSGSGKSTLLNLIGLLEPPSGGSYLFAGSETTTLPDDELTALRARTHRLRLPVPPSAAGIHRDGERADAGTGRRRAR